MIYVPEICYLDTFAADLVGQHTDLNNRSGKGREGRLEKINARKIYISNESIYDSAHANPRYPISLETKVEEEK